MERDLVETATDQRQQDLDAIKLFLARLWKWLGSRQLALGILIAASTYAFMLAAWGAAGSSTARLSGISSLLSFKILYALFFLNQLVCWIDFLPVTYRRLRLPDLDELDRYPFTAKLAAAPEDLEMLERLLSDEGFKVRKRENSLTAVKGRLSPLGNTLFHLSFILLLLAVAISDQNRFEGYMRVHEGQAVSGLPQEYISYIPREDFADRSPKLSFLMEEMSAEFWKDNLLFTDLRATLKYPLGEPNDTAVARLSAPFFQDGSYLALAGYGYAPKYRLEGETGLMVEETKPMNLFPPGNEESLLLPGLPHRVTVRLYPDFFERKGRGASRSMNLKNPRFWVSVMRGKLVVAQGYLRPGEQMPFEAYKLSFPSISKYGDFRVVKDPGRAWLIWGFWLACAGLCLRLLVPRREVSALLADGEADSTITIAGKAEWFGGLWRKEWENIINAFKSNS